MFVTCAALATATQPHPSWLRTMKHHGINTKQLFSAENDDEFLLRPYLYP